jgi:cytochrome c peroxidase
LKQAVPIAIPGREWEGGSFKNSAFSVITWLPRTHPTLMQEVTKSHDDKGVFRVPGLRNVAKTATYFHDGSVADLKEAVKFMSRLQLNIEL